MTTNSYTGSISTDGVYKSIAEVASFSFTTDKVYTMQVQNIADIKIADAEFTFQNEKFYYTATADDIYIRTHGNAILTILEQ